jgi:hypothetical protein
MGANYISPLTQKIYLIGKLLMLIDASVDGINEFRAAP